MISLLREEKKYAYKNEITIEKNQNKNDNSHNLE